MFRVGRVVASLIGSTCLFGLASEPALAAVPNDPGFARQYSLQNTGQTLNGTAGRAGADIDAPGAWNLTTGSASVIVADVDDGINYGQSDITPNVIAGYDFGNHDSNPTETACCHGSQTAAVLGARGDNALGIAGVSWNVSIMPLKVRTDGAGARFTLIEPTAVADAFRYAATHGARVVTASLALRSTTTTTERAAVLQAINDSPNTLFVVSAGNDPARNNDTSPRYPCSFDVANVICVTGTDQNDQPYGSYGPKSVDLAAPAVNIYTVNGTNTYGYVNGTSYATPMVSGVAALYLSRYPSATTADIRRAILQGVDPKPGLTTKTVTGGRLNANTTLTITPSSTPPPPPPPPATGALDDFSRTVTGGWGTASTGGDWSVVAGGAASFSVDGAQGLISSPSRAGERQAALTSTSLRDLDARADVTFPNSPGTGGTYYTYVTLRRQSDGSHIRVGLIVQGTSVLIRGQTSAGTTLWTNVNTNLGFTAGAKYSLRLQAQGSSPTTLRARAWKQGTAEPTTWAITATTSSGPQVAGAVGIRTFNDTAASTTFAFDDYAVTALP